jgi:polyhydroxyalkanoate synthesis repressor PhaR
MEYCTMTTATPEQKGELLVKKYGNRRLYDTESSRYITLEDLALIVKTGRDIRVMDAKTNKDLTKSVLLQIISEREKDHDLLPVSFLKKMIQLSDQTVRDSLHRYLRVSLDAFLTAQKEFEERYKSFAGTFMSPMSNIGPMFWPNIFGRDAMPPGAAGATPPPVPAAAPSEPAGDHKDESAAAGSTEDQLRALQQQMAAMNELLGKLQKKR